MDCAFIKQVPKRLLSVISNDTLHLTNHNCLTPSHQLNYLCEIWFKTELHFCQCLRIRPAVFSAAAHNSLLLTLKYAAGMLLVQLVNPRYITVKFNEVFSMGKPQDWKVSKSITSLSNSLYQSTISMPYWVHWHIFVHQRFYPKSWCRHLSSPDDFYTVRKN